MAEYSKCITQGCAGLVDGEKLCSKGRITIMSPACISRGRPLTRFFPAFNTCMVGARKYITLRYDFSNGQSK